MLNYHNVENNLEGMVKMNIANNLTFILTIGDQVFRLMMDESWNEAFKLNTYIL